MPPSAPVFDIQRFSLHDGPGIRSLVFLKGCGLECPWCQNPESQSTRPVIAFHLSRCHETFECEAVCPNGAIIHGDYRVDHQLCNRCGLCVEACPHEALRLIGQSLSPEALMAQVLVDRTYYESSGGGVTFTGGEPTLHSRFLTRALELCAEARIHTNIETSGRFDWPMLEPALKICDLIYFDLKILDPALHRRHLGDGLDEILHNAERMVSDGFPVEFRMPVVEGFTDDEANIEAIIGFLNRVGRPSIHLLAYHNMGETKIDIIHGSQPKLGLASYPEERLAKVTDVFRNGGIEVVGR